MFELNLQYRIKTSLPVITGNYKILHYDEFPILFSGTNNYGNKLIGSYSYEDDETDLFRYFLIIVSDKQYVDFYNGKISYRSLIETNESLFIIDKDINDHIIDTFHVPLESIPADYLPHIKSFIPLQKQTQNNLNFAFSLKGKLADLHKAKVNDINNVNERIYNYLQDSLETLNVFQLNPIVYSQPSQAASYRLNFDIEFKQEQQMSMFPIDKKKVGEFLQTYLNYISYSLPEEDDGFLEDNPEKSKGFSDLKSKYEEIFTSYNTEPLSAVSDILVENISSSAEKLSEVTEYLKSNNSFDSILLGYTDDNGGFSTIGYLIEDYKALIDSKILHNEEELYIENIIVDPTPQSYRILVYDMNTETGKGRARLYPDDTEDYYRVKLHVYTVGDSLSNSIFTKSLNESKVVNVEGIGTRINGVFKKLECYIELKT
ncbi:hypothetical protein [Pedobacter jeongneungensis]|uniref:hypothetical protein n=1 Tax=Pedobacter jeongneungensis TaxID=947309 RepID=UPI0004695E29|nr:hypothetical protein [Pedobacter jeongneungensis]